MDIKAQLEKRLTEYVEETLGYIKTVRAFCDQEEKWTSDRKQELKKMRHINENQKEEKLDAVLKDTLEGLKKLEPFLDALEKLTVTSSHVFIKEIFLLRGESPETVQSVILATRIDAPVLILFRRDEQTFFQPLLENLNILIHQLGHYRQNTEQLCERVRDSALAADIYKEKPSVQLIVNMNEKAMQQMLDHLEQLCEIRMNQDTRLAFLFQKHVQTFIDVFSVERRSRMKQFLSDLEETANKLDSMKKGASIANVVGSSVGIVGGVLDIAGLILAPFTGGASLIATEVGIGLSIGSGVETIVTEGIEKKYDKQQEQKAKDYLQHYKEDMTEIEDCLKEVANSEGPLVQSSAVDPMIVAKGAGEIIEGGVDGFAAYAGYKSEKVTEKGISVAVRDLEAAGEGASSLVTLKQLENMKTLRIAKVSRIVSGIGNVFFIGLDAYSIYKEAESLKHGSKSELSNQLRSRAALYKSELEAWEKMHKSLHTGIETFSKSQETLKKPFLPEI